MEEIPRDQLLEMIAVTDEKSTRAMLIFLDKIVNITNINSSELRAIGSSVDSLHEELITHMEKEEKEDKEIADRIQALSDKIDSFAPMKKAFIHIDGVPQYDGHQDCQMRRATDTEAEKKRWDKYKDWVGEVVVKGLAYGFIALLLLGVKDWVSQQSHSTDAQPQHIESKK